MIPSPTRIEKEEKIVSNVQCWHNLLNISRFGEKRGTLDWLGWSKYTNYHFNSAKFVFTLDSRPGMTKAWWDVFNGAWLVFGFILSSCSGDCRPELQDREGRSCLNSELMPLWGLQHHCSHDLDQNAAEKLKLQQESGPSDTCRQG